MNAVEEQTEVLTELSNILVAAAPESFYEARCVFEYGIEGDGSSWVDARFWYVEEGKCISTALETAEEWAIMDLVPKLHQLMKEHTGGTWSEMTLTLTADGQLNTEFKYPDAS